VQLVLFGLVMVVFAAAGVLPLLRAQDGRLSTRDGLVSAGGILAGGLGLLNLGGVVYLLLTGDGTGLALGLGVLPLAAAFTAWRIVGPPGLRGFRRGGAALAACALVAGGIPAYFALPVAVVGVGVAVACFLGGIAHPGSLARRFDPRV
jgi:hypothetical protein